MVVAASRMAASPAGRALILPGQSDQEYIGPWFDDRDESLSTRRSRRDQLLLKLAGPAGQGDAPDRRGRPPRCDRRRIGGGEVEEWVRERVRRVEGIGNSAGSRRSGSPSGRRLGSTIGWREGVQREEQREWLESQEVDLDKAGLPTACDMRARMPHRAPRPRGVGTMSRFRRRSDHRFEIRGDVVRRLEDSNAGRGPRSVDPRRPRWIPELRDQPVMERISSRASVSSCDLRRQRDAARRPHEQRRAQSLLEPADLTREGLLGDEERLAG